MKLTSIDQKSEEKKIAKFIGDTFNNASKNNAMVAVSGGVDSATTLLLTVKALGAKNVLALHLPSKTSDPVHTKDVIDLLTVAKIPEENRLTINIGSIVQKTWRIIKHYVQKQESGSMNHKEVRHLSRGDSDDEVGPLKSVDKGIPDRKKINGEIAKLNKLRLANISARVRMMVLYDQAKLEDALVVGTENYSEHLLGYYTRFGDEASDLEPIKQLYKTQVFELAEHLGVPKDIISKEPSADLWSGQTDEGELGFGYADADPILFMIDQGKSLAEIIKSGFEKKLVENVMRQVKANDFKHQVPYSILKQ